MKVTIAVQPAEGQELLRIKHYNPDDNGRPKDYGVDVGTNVTIELAEGDTLLMGRDEDMIETPAPLSEEEAAAEKEKLAEAQAQADRDAANKAADEAEKAKAAEAAAAAPAPEPQPEPQPEPETYKELDKMNLKELKATAEAEGIELEEDATKAEIAKAIRDARATYSGPISKPVAEEAPLPESGTLDPSVGGEPAPAGSAEEQAQGQAQGSAQ